MGNLTRDFGERESFLRFPLFHPARSELNRKSSTSFHQVPPPRSAVQGDEEWSVIQGAWGKRASQQGIGKKGLGRIGQVTSPYPPS